MAPDLAPSEWEPACTADICGLFGVGGQSMFRWHSLKVGVEGFVNWLDHLRGRRRATGPGAPLTFGGDDGPEAAPSAPKAVGNAPVRKDTPAPPAPSAISGRSVVGGPAVMRETRASRKLNGSAFPRFQATAGDQVNPRVIDQFTEARMRLRTAFTPSQPVVERRLFAGRTGTLTTLIRAIEDERLHVIVYGERGIGKTSLMHVLAEAARDARYLVSYVSCGASSNFDETFRAFANDVPLLFHSAYGPTSPEAEKRATVASLLPPEPVSVRLASDIVSKLVGTRAIIVLDEFDRVESAEFRLNIAEFLKNLSDRSIRVQLLIAGVAANLTELLAHIPSIQRSIFALEVPRMTEAEVRQLVKNGEELSGLRFNETATSFVVAAASGSPYLASLLSHHAGLKAIEGARMTVTSQDVSTALAEALAELKGRISKRSQVQIAACVRDGSYKLLSGLSGAAQLGGGVFSLNDVASIWPAVEGAARYRSLVEKFVAEGMLIERHQDELGECYRFTEDSVPIYLWLLAAQARLLEGDGAGSDAPQRRGAPVAI